MNVLQAIDLVRDEKWRGKFLCNRSAVEPMDDPPGAERSVLSRPLMLHIETTNTCNHSCIFCAQEHSLNQRMVLSQHLFHKAISDYQLMGGGGISFTPSPGEVFFDPLLLDRLQALESYPSLTPLSITTNGLGAERWSDEQLQFILSRLKRIHVSIYGLGFEEYGRITRRMTYQRCVDSIRRIVRLSRPNSVVFGFRFLWNHGEDAIRNWIEEHFQADIPYSYTKVYTTWGSLLNVELHPLFGDALWRKMPEITGPCFRPLISIKVCANGDVSLCMCADHSARDLLLGSIQSQSLESLYNSSICRDFWNTGKTVPESCRKCSSYSPFSELRSEYLSDPISYIAG